MKCNKLAFGFNAIIFVCGGSPGVALTAVCLSRFKCNLTDTWHRLNWVTVLLWNNTPLMMQRKTQQPDSKIWFFPHAKQTSVWLLLSSGILDTSPAMNGCNTCPLSILKINISEYLRDVNRRRVTWIQKLAQRITQIEVLRLGYSTNAIHASNFTAICWILLSSEKTL